LPLFLSMWNFITPLVNVHFLHWCLNRPLFKSL
jgi:hypothetical protein